MTKKNIWHEYSLFYKPTVQKFSKQPVSKGHCIEMTSNLWGRSKDVLGGLVKTPTSHQKLQICEPSSYNKNIVKLMKSTVTQEHIQLLVKKELISGYWAPCQSRGPARRGPMSPVWILKRLVSVFINACCLLSALPPLSQFGRGRSSLVAISFYVLSPLFGPCHLSEFTLAGPQSSLSSACFILVSACEESSVQ